MFFTKYDVCDKFIKSIFGREIGESRMRGGDWKNLVNDPKKYAELEGRAEDIDKRCESAITYFKIQTGVLNQLVLYCRGALMHSMHGDINHLDHEPYQEGRFMGNVHDMVNLNRSLTRMIHSLDDGVECITGFRNVIKDRASKERVERWGHRLIWSLHRVQKFKDDYSEDVRKAIDAYKGRVKLYVEFEKALEQVEKELEKL